MAKYSIIIPCYNVFNKINKCLSSLENQTYKNFEVIFIDDYSTDDTYNFLKKYKDNSKIEIKLYKNDKNLGAAATRNYGITLATGEYIIFIDSDDYIQKELLEKIDGIVLKRNCDCVIYDYYKEKDDKKRNCISVCGVNSGNVSIKETIVNSNGTVWGKAYRLSIIKDKALIFPNLKRNEDMPFSKVFMSFCNSIYYLKEPLYHYVYNENSLMNNSSLIDPNNAKKAYAYIADNINTGLKYELQMLYIKEVLYSTTLSNIKLKLNNKQIVNEIKILEQESPFLYKNKYIKQQPFYVKVCLLLIKYRIINGLRLLLLLKKRGKND